ncbi:MAG: hypothetical protein IJQ39_02460 [Thermoguttaceae bacterium]|nr:hypothetical protein [Thermoguttaceae bacterium]
MPKTSPKSKPPAMILYGGKGARLRNVSERLLIRTSAAFGVNRFILCLDYKKEEFIDYFLYFHAHSRASVT